MSDESDNVGSGVEEARPLGFWRRLLLRIRSVVGDRRIARILAALRCSDGRWLLRRPGMLAWELESLMDSRFYTLTHEDLSGTHTSPLLHYIAWGAREGRSPNPLFDTSYYLSQNPDVAAGGLNPLAHYIIYGAAEGRNPHPAFNTTDYLARRTEVTASGINPLAHRLAHPENEDRETEIQEHAPSPGDQETEIQEHAPSPGDQENEIQEHTPSPEDEPVLAVDEASADSSPADSLDLDLLASRYANFPVAPLSYATVRDYCDSFDHLPGLATAVGDMKDCQRPWMLKALLSSLPKRGRLVEIGAGDPLVADLLQRIGYEVWVVDPYDGSAGGPTALEHYRRTYPNIRFVQSMFGPDLAEPGAGYFDGAYSISVLEHVGAAGAGQVFRGLKRFLKPGGVHLHAIDHVHRGRRAREHLDQLRLIARYSGISISHLDRLLAAMSEDTETYFLSAESHNRWRGGVPYDEFPMRVVVSIQLVASAAALSVDASA